MTEQNGQSITSDVPNDKEEHAQHIKEIAQGIHESEKPENAPKEHGMYSSFESWCDQNTGLFNPALLARDIVDNYTMKTDQESDVLYFYDEERGFYDSKGDIRLRTIIENCLNPENRQRRTTETIYLVHSKTLAPIERSKKITVQNGIVDVVSGQLLPFTPNEFIVNKLPVNYDATAQCPEIIKFFNEISPSDLRLQFEEIFGYCLYQELPIHKATVLLGEGRNGKSTFLDLLTLFLGRENVSHVTLQQMCEGKFELAELYGKLVNVCDDLPGASLKAVGTFKWVTGNAPIMAQRKHKDPFNFWNTAKMLFGCNKLPRPSEDTIAYFSRFNIIPFNRFFIGETDDKEKLKKISTPTELSGLLNLALAGLKRLLANGDFTNCKSIEENRQLYIRSSDSCKAFVEEQLEESMEPTDYIPTETIYQLYVTYCQENRLPKIEPKTSLTRAIRQTFPNAELTKERVEGVSTWVWQYVKMKVSKKEGKKKKRQNQKKKSVPSVPTVPPFSLPVNFNSNISNKRKHGTSGTVGTVSSNHKPETRRILDKSIIKDLANTVLKALTKCSEVRGSSHTSEIILESGLVEADVQATLKQLQREGRVSEIHQEWWKVTQT